jgi:hypothetical protein
MWSAIGSFLLGAFGWFLGSFFGKPYLDFLQLKSRVHEEIVYAGNISEKAPQYHQEVETLRRLGAQVHAIDGTAPKPLRLFLNCRGYDLDNAGLGLIGLSNSLEASKDERALEIALIQRGLKLPADHADEQLQQIEKRISPGDVHS